MAPPRGRPARSQSAADAALRNSLATVAQAQAAARERERLRNPNAAPSSGPSQTPAPVPGPAQTPDPAQTSAPPQTSGPAQTATATARSAPIQAPGQQSLPPPPPFGARPLAPSPVPGPGAAGTPTPIPAAYLHGSRALGPGGRPGTHGRPGAAALAATAIDLTNDEDIANNVQLINAVDANPLIPQQPVAGPTTSARTAFIRHGDIPVPPQGEFVAIFSSWEVLWHHVSTIAHKQGYRVTKRRSSAYKAGKPGRFDLACDHGGTEYKSTAKERQATSRKTGCPWQARAICMRSMGDQWKFVVACGSHNHPPVNQEAEKARRQSAKRKQKDHEVLVPPVLPMTTGMTDSGQLRAETDPDAQGFMTSVEEAQEKERQRVGLNISEQLYRLEQMIGVVARVENIVLRIEHQFGHRLAAIEQRMAVIEKTWE